jgi:hypothetical protein
MRHIDVKTRGGAVVAAVFSLFAMAAVSCAKVSGGPSSGADDTGGVTSAGAPASGEALPASNVVNVGTQQVAMPTAQAPAAPLREETLVTPPSPAVMQAVTTAQTKLDTVTAGIEGTRVRFVDCSESAACSARLEASSLAGLRDVLQSVSAQQGGIGFVAREQFDAYTGHTYVADISLGGGQATRAVPTDENELLGN